MKLFFACTNVSKLLHPRYPVLLMIRETILQNGWAEEVDHPKKADAIIIQENNEYKDFRYVHKLQNDPFISSYLTKIFTISMDDSATGLFRGLYASITKQRFNNHYHRAVPYIDYTNVFVFSDKKEVEPVYLAGWYGNKNSNTTRKKLIQTWKDNPSFMVKDTQSWYNHKEDEQRAYVDLIKNSKFSLCPAGWSAPSPRIYESMALGRCPVIISDEFVPPDGPDWSEFALFYPQRCITKIDRFLLQHEPRYQELGEKAKQNWDRFFAGDLLKQYYANTLLQLIRSTAPYTKEEEIRRWRSFETYWKNNWTIPQRILNKSKQLARKM